jgi:mannitol operon transcriptional antiterminator
MELSIRQRQAIAILLGSDHEVTLGAIAEALDVSPRTVHRELSRLGPTLEPWGLIVRGRSGQGIQMVGEPDRLRAFQDALGGVPDASYSASDRRWMIATLLLESPSAVKFFALERELRVGTSAVRAELDALELWLAPLELSLVRRRGFGVAVEGPEFQKRLALGAALTDRFSEADLLALFRDAGTRSVSGPVESFLFERYPRATVNRIDALVDQASKKESWDWAPSAGLSLALHLTTSLQRVASGFVLDRVPAPDGDRGPARRLLESLSEVFGVAFPAAEVEWTALHLEAAKPNRTTVSVRDLSPNLVRGVGDLIQAATRRSGFPFDRDALLSEGLTAHWGPALARLSHRLPIANTLLPEIQARFPDLVTFVGASVAEVYPRLVVPAEEIGFLVLHFAASIERSHRVAVPFRALIVCSSGIGTSHMLASRIRAEVPEIEVVANLSWFEVKDFSRERYDLLISTVPLPLPSDDYVVVSPLLDETGLRALKDHLRLRRLRLTADPLSERRVDAAGDSILNVLVEGLSTPEARSAVASGDQNELRAVLARTLGRAQGPLHPQGD